MVRNVRICMFASDDDPKILRVKDVFVVHIVYNSVFCSSGSPLEQCGVVLQQQ